MDSALALLPNYCKARGKRAHVMFYRKLQNFKRPQSLFKFLGLGLEKTKIGVQLYFEVNLIKRVVDCIVLRQTENDNTCFVIELKTCMAGRMGSGGAVRAQQRIEGLRQLRDSTRTICSEAPAGSEEWIIHPVLLFKSQRSLRTIYIEHPTFMTNVKVSSSLSRLRGFFSSRQDKSLIRAIKCSQTCGESDNNCGIHHVGGRAKGKAEEGYFSATTKRNSKTGLATSPSAGNGSGNSAKKKAIAVGAGWVGQGAARQLSKTHEGFGHSGGSRSQFSGYRKRGRTWEAPFNRR
ncbi:putative membrane or tegument protein [Phascolarctid gammaherpesvirus 1]|uniref:Putative membrane or tegument protein n=1 Tax=Phascolarctid gammaherpesvirus 1 TaxID=2249313 RepID=A0A3S8D7G9_9GAMA|nr:putative membrane or tegument protein [Phascolarctid gammaherpesvirus 1]AZB49193.1 putative membrane or tegument protein [Phascolarctid gammaherpesvirus 1]